MAAIGKSFVSTLAFASAACAPTLARADADEAEHVNVQLIAEHASLAPGRSFEIGLLLRHEPHWHTYWINPGDSGLPTSVSWTLPPGYRTQEIAWPLPRRFDVGGLYNFGYDGEILLPISLQVPADASPGGSAHIAVEAKWLVCREACIPGKASLALDLPVTASSPEPDKRWTMSFAHARLAEPQAAAWKAEAKLEGERIQVALRGPGLPNGNDIDAFVEQRKLVDNQPPAIRRDGDALIVDFGKSDYFGTSPATFDLVVTQPSTAGIRGWRVPVSFAAATAAH